MATHTSNLYGDIVVTNQAIRDVARGALMDCYGVADGKIAYVEVEENKIAMVVNLWLKFGVTPEPVCQSVRRTIRYNVEIFTGMTVRFCSINVKGIKD